MRRIGVVARATTVELLRRRTVVVLMVLVPLAFYAARHELVGQSIRFAAIGMAWGLSTLAAFAGIAGQAIDPRLRLGGYRNVDLVTGRVLGLLALALPLAGLYAAVIVVHRRPDRWDGVLLALGLTVLVAIPFGLLVAAVLRRPLEAAMVLLVVSGVQMLVDPEETLAHLLPFWSARSVITWTVDHTGREDLHLGLLHAAVTVTAVTAVTAVVRARSLRHRSHLRIEVAVRR